MPLVGLAVLILWFGGSAQPARRSGRSAAAFRRGGSDEPGRGGGRPRRDAPIYRSRATFDMGMTARRDRRLVAITARRASGVLGGPIIGFTAGVIVVVSVILIDRKLDDPVGRCRRTAWRVSGDDLVRHLHVAALASSTPTGSGLAYNWTSPARAQALGVDRRVTVRLRHLVHRLFVIKRRTGARRAGGGALRLDIVEHGMWGTPSSSCRCRAPSTPARRPSAAARVNRCPWESRHGRELR